MNRDRQSQYETYSEYQHRVLCENSNSLTNHIINPTCVDGRKEYKVIVTYNDVESDTLYLCEACMKNIKHDMRKFGYKIKITELVI